MEPRNVTHRTGLGAALLASGRPADALVALDAAVAIDPDAARAHANRAAALEALGRLPEAVLAALEALEHDPDLALAHQVRARIKDRLG